jgi:hypothetical protein
MSHHIEQLYCLILSEGWESAASSKITRPKLITPISAFAFLGRCGSFHIFMCLQLALFQFVAIFLASYQHLCQSQNLAQEMQSHQSVAGSFGPELDTPRGAKRQGLRGGWQTEGTARAVETPSLSGFSGAFNR